MSFRDQLAIDAAVSLADVGESIVYYDNGNLGTPRTILAHIDRREPAPRIESTEAQSWSCQIHVLNSATTGRAAPTYNDLVDLKLREGGATIRCRVTSIVTGDVGMWTLEVSR